MIDLSGADKIASTTNGMRALAMGANRLDPFTWGKRFAIVAPGDEAYGVARQYHAMRMETPEEIRLFRRLDEANEWLGVPSDYDPWAQRES